MPITMNKIKIAVVRTEAVWVFLIHAIAYYGRAGDDQFQSCG